MYKKVERTVLLVLIIVVGTIALIRIDTPDEVIEPVTTVTTESDINLAVQAHNTRNDCWTIINGELYDITDYIPLHPGGVGDIMKACGIDATSLFNNRNGDGEGHSTFANDLLKNMKVSVGSIADATTTPETQPVTTIPETNTGTNTPEPKVLLDTGVVAKHNTKDDCWIIVNNNVYQVTDYIPLHPGGSGRIIATCGTDASTEFETRGGDGRHSSFAHSLLENYLVGPLGEQVAESATEIVHYTVEEQILKEYPGAVIDEVNYEDDGRVKVTFFYEGRKYYTILYDGSGDYEDDD